MKSRTGPKFVRTTLVLCVLAIAAATIVSPPDPITMLYYLVPPVLLAPVVSYLATSRGRFDAPDARE